MTLLAPGALWWLLTVVPVAALFLFRRRISEVEIPALIFWEQTQRRDTLGRWGRRLRRWLSLLVQLLIILALVVALAEPIDPIGRDELIVVLDDSATMQTMEEDDTTVVPASRRWTRFDLVRQLILDRLRDTPTGVRTTVILAGTPPKIIADRETVSQRVRAALSKRRPRDVNPQIDQALEIARRKRHNDTSTILIISDRHDPHLAAQHGVEWLRIGHDHPNVGISAVVPTIGEQSVDVILNHRRMTPATVTVSLIVNERVVTRTNATLYDGPTVARLSAALDPGEPFLVRVEPPDAFELDNTAFGVWPAPSHVRLKLVTAGNPFLEAALDQPNTSLNVIQPGNWPGEKVADVTILDSPRTGPGKPTPGRFIVFGGSDPFGVTRAGPAATDLTPTQWSADNPLLRDVDLLRWHIDRTAGMLPPRFAQCVAQSSDVPLVFVVRDPGQPEDDRDDFAAIYVNFDLAHSNITHRAGFPVFLWNAIDHLLNRRPEDTLISYVTGVPLSFPPQRRSDTRVTDPSGRDVQAFFDDGRLVVPFPEHVGFYRLDTGGKRIVRAVNYISDGVRAVGGPDEGAVARPPPRRPTWLATLPPWGVLVAAAGALLLIETLLFHRGILKVG